MLVEPDPPDIIDGRHVAPENQEWRQPAEYDDGVLEKPVPDSFLMLLIFVPRNLPFASSGCLLKPALKVLFATDRSVFLFSPVLGSHHCPPVLYGERRDPPARRHH
jgi:hypothetical protein